MLTAAMVGALAQAGCRLTFTEMFCPDWEGNTIFMSHMGECSLGWRTRRPKLVEKSYGYSATWRTLWSPIPKVAPGEATLVNLAPGPRQTFTLITARVEVLDRGPVAGFPGAPHFWLRPLNTDLRASCRATRRSAGRTISECVSAMSGACAADGEGAGPAVLRGVSDR
jgi:L-arabinose isomerase